MKKNRVDKQVTRYIHKVHKLLKCSAKSKRNFIAHLKSSIDAFRNDSPDCTIEDIIEFLGQPEKLARSFMETLDKKEIKRAKRNVLIRNAALVVVLVCILALLLSCIYTSLFISGGTLIESPVSIVSIVPNN